MTNTETQRDETQPQIPGTNPTVEASLPPDVAQAQSEFLEIKQALTDRQATPDPMPGWILPRVDAKAAASDPKLPS
ncbi:hypothetical protein [Coleofasciculus sp. F4-SAH-05]|uniref:hypothetical protein n=1 Tax=Coleofasciculus sp. F4-SAH-05 TaxID=3069525 RepID=UPI003304FED0